MGIIDTVIGTVNPNAALRRAKVKSEIANIEVGLLALEKKKELLNQLEVSESDTDIVTNSGYSHGGASRRRSWAKKYKSSSYSPKEDIEKNRKLLRERSRDLTMNAPLATAAVVSTRTSCIGSGLVPTPKIDYEFLGISKEEANRLKKLIKKEFSLWAESTLCDNNDQNNFYALQQIAFIDWLKNGEEFVIIKYDKTLPYMPYQLRLKLVEADRVCTKGSLSSDYDGVDRKEKNGNTVMNGIEIDSGGKVVAYHIASRFPDEFGANKIEWERIEKRGKRTGNQNILHVFNGERAEQYRGVPFLAPVIQSIKQLTRYTEAEIMAAVINSMFTIFIQTETGNEMSGFNGVDENEGDVADDETEDNELELGYGVINELKAGESVNAVESTHPSGNFGNFVSAMSNQIGAALEIAPEVLLKKFQNNFSASKGALNETWRAFKMRRKWFIDDFCQEVYKLWFNEAVAKGRIHAPGYFENPLIQQAYTKAVWNGPAQGHLNPVQEVNAATIRVKNGFSTHEDECASMNGSDYEDNIRELSHENKILQEALSALEKEE